MTYSFTNVIVYIWWTVWTAQIAFSSAQECNVANFPCIRMGACVQIQRRLCVSAFNAWHRCKRTRQQFLIHTCAFREKYCVRLDKARRGTICSTFIIIFFLLSFLFLLFLCQEFKKILSKIWCFTIRLYAVKCVSSTLLCLFLNI